MVADNSSLADRARRLYDTIRGKVEAGHDGEYLVLNLDTGEWEVGGDDLSVSKRAAARFPGATLFAMRVGRRAAYRIGFRATERRR